VNLHGYLKGIRDGEGWVDLGDANIGIAQNPGPVLDEIGDALAALDFVAYLGNTGGKNKVKAWSLSGIGQCLRFLGEVRPTRLLQRAECVYSGRMLSGGAKKNGQPTAVVVRAVECVGKGATVALQTTSSTVIAEGLCTSAARA
jgi:hypothetical protein